MWTATVTEKCVIKIVCHFRFISHSQVHHSKHIHLIKFSALNGDFFIQFEHVFACILNFIKPFLDINWRFCHIVSSEHSNIEVGITSTYFKLLFLN